MVCIGLFGTCGGSRWRDTFMPVYDRKGIAYFNPQVDDWKPELAAIEAEHLATDEIVLFPITDETYGLGSLAETGFSVLQAIRSNQNRFFVVMIDRNLRDGLDDPNLRMQSIANRRLVLEHLMQLRIPGLFMVDSLDKMLTMSLLLHDAAHSIEAARQLQCV